MSRIVVPPPVQALIDAINAADMEAFMSCFLIAGAINDHGRVLAGTDGVRRWAESDAIGVGARMRLVEAGTTDATTHLVFDWSSRVFNGRSEAFVTVRNGLVAEFRIPPQ